MGIESAHATSFFSNSLTHTWIIVKNSKSMIIRDNAATSAAIH